MNEPFFDFYFSEEQEQTQPEPNPSEYSVAYSVQSSAQSSVVWDLGDDSGTFQAFSFCRIFSFFALILGSDENISAEAKRIRNKHLQERRKIKKLGNLV